MTQRKKVVYHFDVGFGGIGDFFKFFVCLLDICIANNFDFYYINTSPINNYVKTYNDKYYINNIDTINFTEIMTINELYNLKSDSYILVSPSSMYSIDKTIPETLNKYNFNDLFYFTDDIKNKAMEITNNEKYISLHLRLGDLFLETDKSFLQNPKDTRNYDENKIFNFIENNNTKTIYFFCDNVSYRNKIKQKYNYVKTTELSVGHTSLKNTQDIDFFNACVEFYILSQSEEIYMCSYSGFSLLASKFGNKKIYDINTIKYEKEDLVSVIIPTYNRFKYLLNTINSVKSQTYKNIEIIVVNDCSTEKEYYEYNYGNNVKIINLPENSRIKFGYPCVGYVRNIGIQESNGKYIAFCDDDDIWLPDKIKMQINDMKKTGCKFSCTEGLYGSGIYNPDTKYLKYFGEKFYDFHYNVYNQNIPEILNLNFIKKANCIICSSAVVEKEILTKINNFKTISMNNFEDYDCWKRSLEHTNCVFVNTPLVYYDSEHGDGRNY